MTDARRALPVALQLYTLRGQFTDADSLRATVHQVAGMGYDGVQFYSYAGLDAAAMRSLLADAGVRPAGTHVALEALEADLDREVDFNGEIGNRWIFAPYLMPARRQDLAGWRQAAASLNEIGARCRERGLIFGYHNHDFEYEPIPDAPHLRGIDVVIGETDPACVVFEPDVFWIAKGGADPVAALQAHAGRIPIIHCKDMTPDDRRTFAEVGQGILDWPGILDASEAGGVEWLCVEQDAGDRPLAECARTSIGNLRSWGMGQKGR